MQIPCLMFVLLVNSLSWSVSMNLPFLVKVVKLLNLRGKNVPFCYISDLHLPMFLNYQLLTVLVWTYRIDTLILD